MPDDRYLVSARKYRPTRFSDLVAQEHVANTLRNALIQDRLAHAYLFSGPRGVGKTTAARILARAINCETPFSERENGEPCGECSICESFEEGRNLNIIEIDAASNNSVDDVRALREKVRIPPQGARKKVYIIDEVHMLSNQAFNALLKTLEEPPPHVLFIFATTEPHKVLPTILSRCQRFDFHRIPVSRIVDRLRYICREEDVAYDEESLMLIAKKGNGALRDALSVFDQAIALCGMTLQYDELARALGVVDVDLFFEVTHLVEQQDSAGMIELVDRIMARGHDLLEFLDGLTEHLRNLLVAHTTGATKLIQASEGNKARYAEAARSFREPDLLRLLMIASDTASEIKSSTQPRLQVELALVKMAHLERTADLERLLEKIERLEELADEGELPGDGSATVGTGERGKERGREGEREDGEDGKKERKGEGGRDRVEPGDAEGQEVQDEGAISDRSGGSEREEGSESSCSVSESASADRSSSSEGSDAGGGVLGPPALGKRRSSSSGESSASSGPSAVYEPGGAESSQTAVAEPPAPGSGEERRAPDEIVQVWEPFVRSVREEKKGLGSVLAEARPGECFGDRLRVRVPRRYHKDMLRRNERLLQSRLQHVLDGGAPSLVFVVDEDLNKNPNGEPSTEADPFEHIEQLRDKDPVLKEIFDRFGGEFVYE